jgi:protoheme IX farnesyltransferase
MSKENEVFDNLHFAKPARLADYIMLAKFRLSFSVVFSAVAGYLLASPVFSTQDFLFLVFGGFLVVAASNGFNQVIERNRDALMDRTKNRPLPAGRMTVLEAMIASSLFMVSGLALLYIINPLSASFGALSIFIYVCIYTPLKGYSPLAVFVGAIPGAIPFMLGWVAATNDFDIEPGTLFAIQFFWQFPHFWAIAWVAHDDYAKAGYYLLPNRKKNKYTTHQILIYTMWLIFVSIIPVFGFSGNLSLSWWATALIVLLGFHLLYKAIKLNRGMDVLSARALMISSIIYLPLVQIIYVIDRWI